VDVHGDGSGGSSASSSSSSSSGSAASAPCLDNFIADFLNTPRVRRLLHVDEARAAPVWTGCSTPLNDNYNCQDTLVDVAPLYAALAARGKRVLLYSGDVDGVVPTLATRRWLRRVAGAAGVGWRPWFGRDGQLAGYTETFPLNGTTAAAKLEFATVRGAGHMVPRFQPERAFELAQRFVVGA